jgi:hypothetical protein
MKKLISFGIITMALFGSLSRLFAEDLPAPIPVYEVEGSLYNASAIESLRAAMAVDSEKLLAQMQAGLTAAVKAQTGARLANTDTFLDWYFGYLTSYNKAIKTITGSIEKWEEENFDRIINSGVDTDIIPQQIAVYQKMVMDHIISYSTSLQNSRVNDAEANTIITGTMNAAELFAPFSVLQALDNTAAAFGIDASDFLNSGASIVSKALSGLQLVTFPLLATTKPIVSKGAGVVINATKKLFTKFAGKYFGKAAAAIAGKIGGKTIAGAAAKAGGGAAAGAVIGGPVGFFIGLAAGIIIDFGLDVGINKLDELLNRDKMKAEIESAIRAEQESLLAGIC